ncbi:hypothetical protein ES708_31940 [subsurface metagenome]
MAGRLPYIKRKVYPHMVGEEIGIWGRFVDKFPDRFETVDYDFRVGEGIALSMEEDENYSRMAKMLSQKRIDVVGWVGDSPVIIEVKKRVGLSTLGQVLGYRILFENEFKNFPSPDFCSANVTFISILQLPKFINLSKSPSSF